MGPVEAAEQGEGGGLVKKSPPHARTQAGALEGQGGGVVALDVQGGALWSGKPLPTPRQALANLARLATRGKGAARAWQGLGKGGARCNL